MANIEIFKISSLEKVMPYKNDFVCIEELSALKGERISWQIALRSDEIMTLNFSINSKLVKYISARRVGYVPVELASYDHDCDDDYISHDAGIYPDILYPLEKNIVIVKPRQFTTLWLTAELPESINAGDYDFEIIFENIDKNIFEKRSLNIHVINAVIPKQQIKYTQWLHADCIADYYNYPVFSEEHWRMIEKFISTAAKTGINIIYTPIFTPPLDTKFGNERTTIQLIDVYKNSDGYAFEFDKLQRWLNLCRSYGINSFEFSHLFSQWGAKYTPKIIANTKNGREKIFGWETSSKSKEYEIFLRQMLEALNKFLKKEDGEFYFHISDEPDNENIDFYLHGYNIVKDCIKDYKIIDAFSEPELYGKGVTKYPIPNILHAEEFYKLGVEENWTYYSCSNNKEVCNRYIAMPSYRNRAIGLQFYKFHVDGFLHWGYNFYNSGLSDFKINPFAVTDAYGLMPAGDSFSVYPGSHGPIESIRSAVFYEALSDASACKLLEALAGENTVLKIIEKYGEITFKSYPKSIEKLLDIRISLNKEIEKAVKKIH